MPRSNIPLGPKALMAAVPATLFLTMTAAAQGLPPIQHEFGNGATLRQLEHPRRPALQPGLRRLALRERQRDRLRPLLD